ncbi:hypothetical protein [Emcibacter sp.]|uniref:hypothetical protein n=1 Tax=Emcibacter sp. TaxID=1979954 RepID=UPI003A955E3A
MTNKINPQSFNKVDALRMYEEAKGRIYDAELLQGMLTKSDSASIIKVLGFEVLLKCALCISAPKQSRRGHKYGDLWSKLPSNVQNMVLDSAKSRMEGHADFRDIDRVSGSLQIVFEKA